MSDSGQMEQQLEDASTARRDLEDSSKAVRNLEKQLKSVTQEKDDVHKVPVLLAILDSLWYYHLGQNIWEINYLYGLNWSS